jgi:hypothetical protein
MQTNEQTPTELKNSFITEWEQFDKQNKDMKRKILRFFMSAKYSYQTKHNEPRKIFKPVTFSQIDELFGLAYTSTGMFAALWICNGVNIWADETRRFYGFAIGKDGHFYAIAEDENEENQLIIKM